MYVIIELNPIKKKLIPLETKISVTMVYSISRRIQHCKQELTFYKGVGKGEGELFCVCFYRILNM